MSNVQARKDIRDAERLSDKFLRLARKYAGRSCLVDGKPATIHVSDIPENGRLHVLGGLMLEFHWLAIDVVMGEGGFFRSNNIGNEPPSVVGRASFKCVSPPPSDPRHISHIERLT